MNTENITQTKHSKPHKKANMQRRAVSDSLSQNAALGKDDNIAATRAQSDKFRSYRLLSFAQKVLFNHDIKAKVSGKPHKTRFCHAVRKHGASAIVLKVSPEGSPGAASLSGVQTCGSVWSCAVCARRLAMERGKEIKKALGYGRDNGLMPVMLTLTASHKLDTLLKPFKTQFKAAYRTMTKSRAWRRLLRSLGIQHTIKAVEVTRTYENGWHYHYHILMLIDKALMMALSDEEINDFRGEIVTMWLAALAEQGLHGDKKHAVNLSYHGNVEAKYLSKLGLQEDEQSNLEYELSAGANKGHDYKGRNVWAILESASRGNKEDEKLYIEYVQAMQGENWINWSHGLKKLVGLDDISDEQATEAAAESEAFAMQKLIDISDEDFRPVRYYRAQADLLQLAALTRSVEDVLEFLDMLKTDYIAAAGERRERLQSQFNAVDSRMSWWQKHFYKTQDLPPEGHEWFNLVQKRRELLNQLSSLEG